MSSVANPIEIHLFVCTNSRADKLSCQTSGGERFRDDLKARLAAYRPRVRVNASGCLGFCAQGAVAVLYPQGQWFYQLNEASLDRIEALIKEQIGEDT